MPHDQRSGLGRLDRDQMCECADNTTNRGPWFAIPFHVPNEAVWPGVQDCPRMMNDSIPHLKAESGLMGKQHACKEALLTQMWAW